MKQLGILATALLCCVANPSMAQRTAPGPQPGTGGGDTTRSGGRAIEAPGQVTSRPGSEPATVDEIIVTARRKSENIERVPVSITAIADAQIRSGSIRTEADLQSAVPGLVIRQNHSQSQFNYSIRGQSVDSFSGSPPGVLPYIDEVQVSAPVATAFYDLESIQVLKGPQGTLFGRNTTGGAVLYDTAAPTNQFAVHLSGRYGNENTRELQGAVNLPVVSDKVLLRVSGDYTKSDGYIRNLFNDGWLGGDDSKSGRISLRLQPIEGLRNDTIVQYSTFGGTVAQAALYSVNACGARNNGFTLNSGASCLYNPSTPGFAAFLAAHPGAYPGGLDALVAYQRALGPYVTDTDYPNSNSARSLFVVNKTTYDLNADLLVKNIVGVTDSTSSITLDIDGTSYPIFQTGTKNNIGYEKYETRQVSEELQLQGKAWGGALDYIIGGYYARERDPITFVLSAFEYTPIFPATLFNYSYTTTDETRAAFEQMSYHFHNGLSVTGGVRYTWETTEIEQRPGGIYQGAPPQSAKSSKPSWNISLEFQQSGSLMLYAATRGSWRTGGFNGVSPPVNAPASGGGDVFNPETTRDFELGAKFAGLIGSTPVRLNAAAYNQWVDDIQRSNTAVVNGILANLTVNVPQATVTGFELDGQLNPLPWLTLGGMIAYTDARFNKPAVSLFGTETNFGPYADAPKWASSVFVQVEKELPRQAGSVALRADAYTQSGQYFSNLNDTYEPNTYIPGYSLANLHLAWHAMFGTKVTPSLYVRNVGDTRYFVGGVPEGGAVGLNNAASGRPRTYGLEVRYDF
jgi:iron complex outermembrane receptor protein